MQVPVNLVSSPLNYTGGKFKLLPQILPLFPNDINCFYDIFCGGCNVSINVTANKIICNDFDRNLIGLLKYFKTNTSVQIFRSVFQIISEFNLSNSSENKYDFYNCNSANGLGIYNKDKFLKLRETFNTLDCKNSEYYTILYVLIVFCFNNQIRFNSDGKFNLPVGKRDFNIRMQKKLSFFLQEIKKLNFQNKDFTKIKLESLTSEDFIYADPPYLITCASYNEKSWNEEKEKQLLAFLDSASQRQIRFALSNVLETDGKENTFLKNWLKENKQYNCHNLDFSYKNSNYHKKNITEKSKEVLITNY